MGQTPNLAICKLSYFCCKTFKEGILPNIMIPILLHYIKNKLLTGERGIPSNLIFFSYLCCREYWGLWDRWFKSRASLWSGTYLWNKNKTVFKPDEWIDNPLIIWKIVEECRARLNFLSKRNSIELLWPLRHAWKLNFRFLHKMGLNFPMLVLETSGRSDHLSSLSLKNSFWPFISILLQ